MQDEPAVDPPFARDTRHRLIREASRAALASAEFRAVLDGLKSRCEASTRHRIAQPRQTDIAFDADRERAEGWVFEPIGNVFA